MWFVLNRNTDNENDLECKISGDYDVTVITSYLTLNKEVD